jgi:hypothetical protein
MSKIEWTGASRRGQAGARPVNSDEIPFDDFPQPIKLRDRKGGEMDEWADDLRVREYPEVKG